MNIKIQMKRDILFYNLLTEKGLEQYRDFFQAFEDNDEYDDSYGGVEDTFEWLIIAENYTALPYEIWLDCVGCDRGSDSIPEIRVHIKEQELLVPVSMVRHRQYLWTSNLNIVSWYWIG